jgi:hypothetical protein
VLRDYRAWRERNKEHIKEYYRNYRKEYSEKNKDKLAEKAKAYYDANSDKISEYNKNRYLKQIETIEGKLKRLLNEAKQSNKSHGPVTIKLEDLLSKWNTQRGRCAVTDIIMELGRKKTNMVSLDRINPNGGYTPDNIRLVCWWVNIARNKLLDDEFFIWCNRVAVKHPREV